MTESTYTGKARGGRARAEALTPERRREIASNAGKARWANKPHVMDTGAPSPVSLNRAVNTLLERNYWMPSLDTKSRYERRHDDTDGDTSSAQDLMVTFGPDGDAWLRAGAGDVLRFRTWAGGGQSLRVRAALMLLAEAIRRDNEERPQT